MRPIDDVNNNNNDTSSGQNASTRELWSKFLGLEAEAKFLFKSQKRLVSEFLREGLTSNPAEDNLTKAIIKAQDLIEVYKRALNDEKCEKSPITDSNFPGFVLTDANFKSDRADYKASRALRKQADRDVKSALNKTKQAAPPVPASKVVAAIGKQEVLRSSNPYVLAHKKENEVLIPSTFESGEGSSHQRDFAPIFFQDFLRNSVQLFTPLSQLGNSPPKTFGNLVLDHFPAFKEAQPCDFDDFISVSENQQLVLQNMKGMYENSLLKEIPEDFLVKNKLLWIAVAKEDLEKGNEEIFTAKGGNYCRDLYALLILDAWIKENTKNPEEYQTALLKILKGYSQALPTFMVNVYGSQLNDLAAQYKLQAPFTTTVILKPEAKVHVKVDQGKAFFAKVGVHYLPKEDKKAAEKGYAAIPEEKSKLPAACFEFELIAEGATFNESKMGVIDESFLMGCPPELLDLESYIGGGDVGALERKALEEIVASEYKKAREELIESAKKSVPSSPESGLRDEAAERLLPPLVCDDPFLDLKTKLKPRAETLVVETDKLIRDSANRSVDEMKKLTSHLKSLKTCFDAKSAQEMISATSAFSKSTQSLKEVPVSDNGEKRMGESGSFLGRVLSVSLGIVGVLAGVVGVALCLTGVGATVGSGLIIGAIFATTTALHMYNGYSASGVMEASYNAQSLFQKAAAQQLEEVMIPSEALQVR